MKTIGGFYVKASEKMKKYLDDHNKYYDEFDEVYQVMDDFTLDQLKELFEYIDEE